MINVQTKVCKWGAVGSVCICVVIGGVFVCVVLLFTYTCEIASPRILEVVEIKLVTENSPVRSLPKSTQMHELSS